MEEETMSHYTADDVKKLRLELGIGMHEAKAILDKQLLLLQITEAKTIEDLKPLLLKIVDMI